jgi:hypothetical protein
MLRFNPKTAIGFGTPFEIPVFPLVLARRGIFIQ